MHKIFLSENLKRRDYLRNVGAVGRIILIWVFNKQGARLRAALRWCRIGTSGRIL
jgi:hypothetical protein